MRNAFASEITALAGDDPRVILLSGDIGNRLFDEYKELYPDRFLNVGVAEANMISMAAGMALSGLRPVVYTITPFITTRCLEQIRDDLCYQRANAVLVAVGGGLSYTELGATHHSCEDIGLLRLLPEMTTVCPGDAVEVRLALRAAVARDGPVYIRIGKRGEPVVHSDPPRFVIGEAIVVREGSDVCLLSTGNLLPTALQAAAELARDSVSARVVSFHTVKPLDQALLADAFTRFSLVVTVEEHSVLGGLGGAVAEWLADQEPQEAPLLRVGTPDAFLHESGEQDFARERWGLTPAAIAAAVLKRYRAVVPERVRR